VRTSLILLAACASHGAPNPPPGCSPLATGQCMTPFPSSWFEQPDQSVVFPDGVLPVARSGLALAPDLLGRLDGFSPATQIVAWFPEGVDASQLTPQSAIADSLRSDNPIALVDVAAQTRVPFFAELDANADPSAGDRQALLIHPMVRLANARRYAVAITTSLRDGSGDPLAPEGQFADWVHGRLSRSQELSKLADRLEQDAAAFAAIGIPRNTLALAWDFDTGSDQAITGPLFAMRDAALAAMPAGGAYTASDGTDPRYFPNAFRVVNGTFSAPSFESGPDPSPLQLDAAGMPVMGAPADWPFTAVIPKCAASAPGPVPLLIVGHGLFDTSWIELSSDDRDGVFQAYCMVAIGTNWIGLSGGLTPDDGAPPGFPTDEQLIATQIATDPNRLDLVTDRLQQAHVNVQVLTRLALNALAADPIFAVNGHAAYDPSRVYYWGYSDGGIQGTTFLALSPDVQRGVLNVPGSTWSMMTWRSGDFSSLLSVLSSLYPDPLDVQLLIAMSQSLWDRTDPIEFAPHLVGTSKHALFQQSMGDALVPNITTELEMRTIGATGLSPLVAPVFGIDERAGPLDGLVYTQWTIDPSPYPADNDVPPPDQTPSAHEQAHLLPAAISQVKMFLQPGGQVVNTCGGVCDFPGGS
jgi:hypothetical protein